MKLVVNSAVVDCDQDYYIMADTEEEENKLNKFEIGGLLCINDMVMRFNGKDKGSDLYCVSRVGQTFEIIDCYEIS